jgi:hypothetical protein
MTTLVTRIGGFAGGFARAFSRSREVQKRGTSKPRPVARANGRANGKTRGSQPAPFQAVEVRRGISACQAAIDLEGQRFLASESPTLPLPDCDLSKCECRFKKFSDRRTAGDRRFCDDHHSGFAGALRKDRRNRRERRRQA